MKRWEKGILAFSVALVAVFAFIPAAEGMHIMEGYLPPRHCIGWGLVCLPFLVAGFISIGKTVGQHRKTLLILAMVGAFVFVLSAMKIPSVSGSSSHPTGTGLGAILFGPAAMSVLGLMVLVFQALLLAHGGLTTLGANTFSMAIAGPFGAFAVYKVALKLHAPKSLAVFLAAFVGDLLTYVVTSCQLAFAHPAEVGGFMASLVKFLGVFAVTQGPLAVIEGLLTVLIMRRLETYAVPELNELGYLRGGAC